MQLYVVRHGETEDNISRTVQGQMPGMLSETGRMQAEHLAERFTDIPLDIVITSDLTRAVQTATPVAQRSGLQVQLDPRLRERHFGEFQGKAMSELVRTQGEVPFGEHLPEGESLSNVHSRMQSFWKSWQGELSGKTAVIVTHGLVLNFLFAVILNQPRNDDSCTVVGNASVSLITRDPHAPCRLDFMNDTSHL